MGEQVLEFSTHVPAAERMTTPEISPGAAVNLEAARERTFRLVLIGLLLLVLGFTAMLLSNGLYPCVPAAGSAVEPPLADCAVSLSPWAAVAVLGLALAAVGYRRAR